MSGTENVFQVYVGERVQKQPRKESRRFKKREVKKDRSQDPTPR